VTKVWTWLKKWGGLLFGGIAAALLFVVGGGWLWRKKRAELGRVKDELAVERAKTEIARLRGLREQVAERVGEKDEAIEEIDRQLEGNRQAIIEAHEVPADMTDEEVAHALREILGA
jgi:hypothetical protein